MMLSGQEIEKLFDENVVVGGKLSNINAASLDVSITDEIYISRHVEGEVVRPKFGDIQFERVGLPCVIKPGDFFLASTNEWVNLPDNISAQVVTKSSAARIGLDHATAGFCDAGFSGNITLEFVNHSKNDILIESFVKLVQLKFFKHEDAGKYSYRHKGQYGGSTGVVLSKGIK